MALITGTGGLAMELETVLEGGVHVHQVEVGGLQAVPVATTTTVEHVFGPTGGTAPSVLRLPAPDGATARPEGLVLDIEPVFHQVEQTTAGRTTRSLDIRHDADVEITGLRIVGLSFPGTDRFLRFANGGVTVETEPDDEDEDDDGDDPDYESVRAVLAAGPAGGAVGPPAVAVPGIGPPGDLYGDQIPAGTVVGSPPSFTIRPPGPLRAGTLQLSFCTGDEAVELTTEEFAVGQVVTTRNAWPEELTITVGDVVIFDNGPPMTGPASISLDPVLGGSLDGALADRASGTDPAELELSVSCRGPCHLRITVRSPMVETSRRPLSALVGLRSPAGPLEVEVPEPGPVAASVRSRVTGAFGPLRRTAASPDGFGSPSDLGPRTGSSVDDTNWIAVRIGPAELEDRPLRRIGLRAAGASAELVVELRSDAGGPGEPVAPPAVVAVEPAGPGRWVMVPIDPLLPDDLADGLWITARTTRGTFLWVDGQTRPTRSSADRGLTWTVPPASPALQLYVDDPGGHAPVRARIGNTTATLLTPTTPTFDRSIDWPSGLAAALGGAEPVTIQIDSARELDVELADLELVDRAPLIVETP